MLIAAPVTAAGEYERFAEFSRRTFGAQHEPLTYQLPGQEMQFLADGAWQHVSENSAVVAVETNLPATVHVEYGPTTAYGRKTEPSDRPYYIHIHYLRGLETGQALHYRVVATDERGNTITGEDQTITPKPIAGAVYLTGKETTPISLDQGGATYVLQGDINADGTALSVVAPGVTIDLNGHTVTYNNAPAEKSPDIQREFGALATEGVQGIRCGYAARASTKVFNGTIRQGAGGGGYGSVPLLVRGTEVAGVTLDYHGSQVSGIDGELKSAHHNVLLDRGTELTNRHQGVQCIGNTADVRFNLIKRARQRGVNGVSGGQIHRNEIYVDSCATNSFGIMFYKSRNAGVTGNRIFGTGYLAIGIGTVSEGVGDIEIARNFIHMQATAPDSRWTEYGEQSGAYCVRVTWGGQNVEYVDNVMVSKGRDGGMVRGIWFCPAPKIENVAFRRNTLKVLADNEKTSRWGAVVISGEDTPEAKPGLFEENTIISNFCHVRLGEEYGQGNNARFVNNTFRFESAYSGDAERYRTIFAGWWNKAHKGNVFIGTKLEGGADFAKVAYEGTGEVEFSVLDRMEVKTTPGATVTAEAGGETVATADADPSGLAVLEVPQAIYRRDGVERSPQVQVQAQLEGRRVNHQVVSATSGTTAAK